MLTLWCIFGSPLMLGAELTKLDDWTLSLLTNKDILAMRNPAFLPHQLCLDEQKAVWTAADAENSTVYTALFNLSDTGTELALPLTDLAEHLSCPAEAFKQLTSLWEHSVSEVTDTIRATLAPHSCIVYRLS